MNKNKKTLTSFVKFCEAHPDMRFWQALVNWSGYRFIYGTNAESWDEPLEDLFYKEER